MAARTLRFGKAEVKYDWNAVDRLIEFMAPTWAAARLQSRVGHALTASWGSGAYKGASPSSRNLVGWQPLGGDADSQILGDLRMLRERSRDLERNEPIAGGAIATTVTHVVGTGLSMQSRINAALLGMSDDEADAWQTDTMLKFEAWASGTDCDITRTQSFYEQQGLALRSVCTAGDHGVLLTRNKASAQAVKLALQHIEADRICNPDRAPDRPGLVAGVAMDAQGAPTAYHIASGNPDRRIGTVLGKLTWAEVPAYGASTRRRNFLHLFERTRAGQTRGVPMLAPVIEPLKQLGRYTDAELTAAVVSGLFTVFITTEGNTTVMPNAVADATAAAASTGNSGATKWDAKLGAGAIVEMGKGDKIESANPGRPNSNFDPFVTAIIRQVGLLLQIPYEVLVKHYTASYSAARAALLDAWRFFRIRREWLACKFCQPVYEAWLDEAVASGHVSAPGYFADLLVRRAWAGSAWVGDGPGAIDPLKEALAAKERVALSISTLAQESILHDGVDWDIKLRQRARERQKLEDAGLPDPSEAYEKPDPATVADPADAPPPAKQAIAAVYREALAADAGDAA